MLVRKWHFIAGPWSGGNDSNGSLGAIQSVPGLIDALPTNLLPQTMAARCVIHCFTQAERWDGHIKHLWLRYEQWRVRRDCNCFLWWFFKSRIDSRCYRWWIPCHLYGFICCEISIIVLNEIVCWLACADNDNGIVFHASRLLRFTWLLWCVSVPAYSLTYICVHSANTH